MINSIMFTFLAFMSTKMRLCQQKTHLCIHFSTKERKVKESKGEERKGFLRRQAAEDYLAQCNRKFFVFVIGRCMSEVVGNRLACSGSNR